MQYLSEFGTHWRRVISCGLGMAVGMALVSYATSVFAPYLVEEFGWDRSQFALIGSMGMVTMLSIPITGYLADKFGELPVAAFGVIGLPITFLANSMMSGDIVHFFAIMVVQLMICSTTSAAVYTKMVAGHFERARGLALALVISAPAAVAAIGSPILAGVIETHGWRAGYQSLAAISAVFGLAALALAPRFRTAKAPANAPKAPRAKVDYRAIATNMTFWILFGSMFMCNIPAGLFTNQLSLVLVENGVTAATAAAMLSTYATGILIGRFANGLALDHLPTHLVAATAMGLPSIGMFLLASNLDAPYVLVTAVMLLGLSQGAEGDMLGFLVVRFFGVEIYGTVVGLLYSAISAASVIGAVLLSLMMGAADSYAGFLVLSGMLVAIGSLLLLMLGGTRAAAPPLEQKPAVT